MIVERWPAEPLDGPHPSGHVVAHEPAVIGADHCGPFDRPVRGLSTAGLAVFGAVAQAALLSPAPAISAVLQGVLGLVRVAASRDHAWTTSSGRRTPNCSNRTDAWE